MFQLVNLNRQLFTKTRKRKKLVLSISIYSIYLHIQVSGCCKYLKLQGPQYFICLFIYSFFFLNYQNLNFRQNGSKGAESWRCFTKIFLKMYLFNVNNRNTRKRCGKCSKLTIKTPERSH